MCNYNVTISWASIADHTQFCLELFAQSIATLSGHVVRSNNLEAEMHDLEDWASKMDIPLRASTGTLVITLGSTCWEQRLGDRGADTLIAIHKHLDAIVSALRDCESYHFSASDTATTSWLAGSDEGWSALDDENFLSLSIYRAIGNLWLIFDKLHHL
ncbi:hypothetical protein NLG97_g2954 [Lecanicillium saksenae]|uniref:Uncharacterized protein n=1 Tax=Lecanicillium saksenae TaxID=468837 RepID=A0ACC1R1C4_9HYPO|nr:hypothetical protein NLG97_g2954 [Lecanicillium saksenae]